MAVTNRNQADAKKWTPAHEANLALVDSDRAQLVRTDTDAQLLLFRQTYVKTLTDGEWELLCAEATARGLSILHKEIAAIKFGSTLAIFPTIHGYYALANATGRVDGMQTYWSSDGIHWAEAWIHKAPPAAAKCELWLKGRARPVVGVATFEERKRMFQPSKWISGEKVNVGEPTLMEQWRDQPARMLGKCAEAAALRMSGLVGSIDNRAMMVDPYEDGAASSFASVIESDEPPADPRISAIRNAHRAASAIGAGDAHRLVHDTVLAANPELVSTRDASAEELNAAAGLIELAGEHAPDAIEGNGYVIDDETGEIDVSAMDEWRATVDGVLTAQQTTEALAELREAAGKDPARWAEILAHPRLSASLTERYVSYAVRTAGPSELYDRAVASRSATRTVEAAAGERAYQQAQATMPRAHAK